jgi:hypothetical protein
MLETRRCSDNGPFVQRVTEPLADRLGTRSAFRVKTGYRICVRPGLWCFGEAG